MKKFVIRQNIRRYRQLLDRTTDETERRQLQRLLAEEEAKLAEVLANEPPKAAE